ncbi:DUF4179 domain-containing protein [Paraeggerthella hominis]|uniref:DUF4179 domain-containing protein n=1 Tax=Paraeggerthella hominis TaxID=2897351 RepID=UPI003D13470F
MTHPMNNDDELRRLLARGMNDPMPPEARAKLERTYASLDSIPQMSAVSGTAAGSNASASEDEAVHPVTEKRLTRRGFVVAAAAVAAAAMLGGAAYAGSRLLQMQPGDALFFQGGKNLPVYSSLQKGVSSLQADVGQTAEVEGVRVTLDSVSCDRSIVNLFFTLEEDGGFDLSELSNYQGSQENDWSKLQNLAPRFGYELTSNGETLGTGSVDQLDAYMEDGKVKVMQRIVPESTLPDQVDVVLKGWAPWSADAESGTANFSMDAGLDLSTVDQPRELGSQDLTFFTSAGEKTMGIKRFTSSELGTVMVVRNDEVETTEESGRPLYRVPDSALAPGMLKVADDRGNVLVPVGAGDGGGIDPAGDYVVEYANLSPDAKSVTFTPMLNAVDWESLSVDERKALDDGNSQQIDVSQIGAKLPTSEYGGYELAGWDVKDRTVSITLKPYGWQAMGGYMELIPEEDATPLVSTWTNPETGETGQGYHSAIVWRKRDYLTGELVQMTSYYAASDEELRGLTSYGYRSAFGEYREESDAAQTVSFA